MTTTTKQHAEDPTWHRLHPRMLLVHPIVEVARALPAIVGIFLAGSAQGHNYWGLAATGVVAVYSLTRWFTTRLRITAQSVQLRQGLLRRKTITTSRERIRTVDVTANPLHRILGLARVVIGTGTNDRKAEGRLVLDGLTRPVATTLRDELLHRRPSDRPDVAEPVGRTTELASLDRRWIRFAPFTLSGVVTGLVIWGFYWRVQGESGVDLLRSGPLRSVGAALRRMPTPVEVLVVVGALVLFVGVTSTVGYILAFWNFRLVQHGGGTLQVTRGLLTTRATSIERRRLVGAALAEPLPLRWVGAARTTAIATGLRTGRGAERGGEVLLPPAPREVATAVIERVLDGSPAASAVLLPHGSAARGRRRVRALAASGILAATAVLGWSFGAPPWLLVLGAVALAVALPLGSDRYRNLGHVLVDRYLVAGSGSLLRRRTVLATDAVIGWNVRSSWFQRRAGLVTLAATTAAGRQSYEVLDLAAQEALAIADEVTPGLLAAFRPAPRPTSE